MRTWLKEIRNKKKWSQEEMAKFLKIPQTTYSCYELGIRNPKVLESKRLADLLKIKWTKFYDIEDSEKISTEKEGE